MTELSPPTARGGVRHVWWILAAAAAVGAGASLPGSGTYVLWAAAVVGGAAAILIAFDQPRWAMVGAVGLQVGYVIDVLRGHGFPLANTAPTILLMLALAVRHLLGLEQVSLPRRELVLLGSIAAVMLISAPFADDYSRVRLTVVEFGKNAVLVLLMVILLDRFRWLVRAIWAWVVPSAVLALLAILQALSGRDGTEFGGFAVAKNVDGLFSRAAGPISSNFFGQLLVVTSVLATYLALADRRPRVRIAAWAATALCVAAAVLTLSRGALLSLVIVAIAVGLLRGVRITWLVAGLGLVATVLALSLPAAVKDRFTVAFRGATEKGAVYEDPALTGRLSENIAAIKMFADNPLVGVGPGNFKTNYVQYSQLIGLDPRNEPRSAHSLYLEALSELGLPGALVFMTTLIAALAGAWRARKMLGKERAVVAEGVFMGLVAYLICAVTLHLAFPRYLWILVGFAFIVFRMGQEEQRSSAGALEPSSDRAPAHTAPAG